MSQFTVNLKVLEAAVALLPAPGPYKGLKHIEVRDRVSALNAVVDFLDYKDGKDPSEIQVTTTTLSFRSVKYCRSNNNCWYEWELAV